LDKELDAKQLEEKIHNLAEAMKDTDVVSDGVGTRLSMRRRSKKNRLERLADDIMDVFEDLPVQNGLFEFALVRSDQQRFVIDQEAYVVTHPQTKEYEFKKETRLGEAIIGRTANRRQMAKLVSRYISEKLLDQQRLLESEFISMKLSRNSADSDIDNDHDELTFAGDGFEYGNSDLIKETDRAEAKEPEVIERVVRTNRTSFFAILTWFMLGILATIAGVVIAALYGQLGVVIDWVQQLVDLITKNF